MDNNERAKQLRSGRFKEFNKGLNIAIRTLTPSKGFPYPKLLQNNTCLSLPQKKTFITKGDGGYAPQSSPHNSES